MGNAGMRRRTDTHHQQVFTRSGHQPRHIEFATQKCASKSAQLLAVEPNLGGIVHTFKRQRQPLAARLLRRLELHAVPVILVSQALWDG